MNMIYGASMRSRSGYLDMASSVSKVAMQAGSLFRTDGKQNNAAIVQFMENYNKMAAISGATQQQTSAAMLQIVQALSSGELRGDELRSVLENMPIVADYLAQKLGVARDQILEMGHDGKISAEVLRDSVMGATDDLNEKMKKIPYTWGQVWTIFKNAALKAFEPVLNGISAILKNEKFLEFANAMGRALVVAGRLAYPVFNALGTVIGWLYDKLKGVYNFIKDNFSWIAPLFLGIAAALVAWYLPLATLWMWTKAVSIATKVWSAAQAVLNAIMAANPVMIIVLAVIALIALIYMLVDESTSATGIIVGCAYWLWEVICNVGKWIANMFCGIVQEIVNRWSWALDNVGIIFDNIGTFWGNLWIDCKIGLNNFVAWAIGKLASLAESISPIAEALGIDTSALSKVANAVKGRSESLEKSKGSYKSLKSWSDKAQTNWETYAYGDLSEAYDKGYKVGAQFEKDVKGKFKGLTEYFSGEGDKTNDFYKGLTGGFNNPATSGATGNPALDKISKDTGDISKNTSDSEEDFSYLRELAEREAINRYTLTDLKIDMTNNNSINNGVDADNMMKRLAKELSRAVLTTAEGVTPW
jgi:tape measure domain-containing protein